MFYSIFYGIVYMIIYLLLNTDIIWKYINDDLTQKIQLLLSFINYIIFYGYINNFLRILRDLIDIDIKKNTKHWEIIEM
jgi:hypothetical protein